MKGIEMERIWNWLAGFALKRLSVGQRYHLLSECVGGRVVVIGEENEADVLWIGNIKGGYISGADMGLDGSSGSLVTRFRRKSA